MSFWRRAASPPARRSLCRARGREREGGSGGRCRPGETAPPSTVSTATPLEAERPRRAGWEADAVGAARHAGNRRNCGCDCCRGRWGGVQPGALHRGRFARPRPPRPHPPRTSAFDKLGGRPVLKRLAAREGRNCQCPGGCLQYSWVRLGPGKQPQAAESLAFASRMRPPSWRSPLCRRLKKGPGYARASGAPASTGALRGQLGLRNGSTAPLTLANGNLLQDFELDSTVLTSVTQDATALRVRSSAAANKPTRTN